MQPASLSCHKSTRLTIYYTLFGLTMASGCTVHTHIGLNTVAVVAAVVVVITVVFTITQRLTKSLVRFLKALLKACPKLGLSYLGEATAAARAAPLSQS